MPLVVVQDQEQGWRHVHVEGRSVSIEGSLKVHLALATIAPHVRQVVLERERAGGERARARKRGRAGGRAGRRTLLLVGEV